MIDMSEDSILQEWMEGMHCDYSLKELRDAVRDSNGFKLHLACVKYLGTEK